MITLMLNMYLFILCLENAITFMYKVTFPITFKTVTQSNAINIFFFFLARHIAKLDDKFKNLMMQQNHF